MSKLLRNAVLGASLTAATLVAAAPADAQRYRYWHRDRDRSGAYLAAGVAGLAIGAALASSANDRYYRDSWYRDRGFRYDYDDYYYRSRGYYPVDGYYAYRAREWDNCRIERRYDPYYGRRVRVQVCY